MKTKQLWALMDKAGLEHSASFDRFLGLYNHAAKKEIISILLKYEDELDQQGKQVESNIVWKCICKIEELSK